MGCVLLKALCQPQQNNAAPGVCLPLRVSVCVCVSLGVRLCLLCVYVCLSARQSL